MRIVSGKWRSKRITAPKNLPTRPTTDFAKESLFNVLNNRFDFEEIRVLDLFSGTGNISYEFASRGTVDLVKSILDIGLLSKGGEAVIEHSNQTDLSNLPGFFAHRKYGHVNFSFFSRPQDVAAED